MTVHIEKPDNPEEGDLLLDVESRDVFEYKNNDWELIEI
jgi:hypothetical protein